MTTDYKYKFAKGKYHCPQCRQKKFVRYEGLPDYFGYCERKNTCGYEFFATKDNLLSEGFAEQAPPARKIAPEVKIRYPDKNQCIQYLFNRSSVFHHWAHNLGIDANHLLKWGIGTDTRGLTVFIFRNQIGRFCNLKTGKYNANGKRDKDFGFYSLPAISETEKYCLPLFGEQFLTDDNKDVPVCVVESEKSAFIASWFFPQFIWESCGSANGLSDGSGGTNDKISPLMNRPIWWFCDADKAGRNNSSIRNLEKYQMNHYIIDLFRGREDGFDIADALIEGICPEFFTSKINEQTGEIINKPKKEYLYKPEAEEVIEETTQTQFLDEAQREWKNLLPKDINFDDFFQFGFYERNNCLFFRTEKDEILKLSNFTIRILFLIRSKTNPKRIVELRNEFGYTALLDLSIDSLVSVGKFNVVTQSEGNFLFEGKEQHLNKLKRKLLQEEKASKEIETLGWQPEDGFYAFSNGIFNGQYIETDNYGIVEHKNTNYFIPALSKIYRFDDDSFVNEKKFVFKKSDLDFSEWAKLFNQVYSERNNGRLGILFYCAAIFRDVIFKRLRFFPLLNLFGIPGSGKSTMALSLMFMFGEKQEPFMLGNAGTTKGFMRKFGQFRNALVWLDEYKNSVDRQKIEALKNIYDGVGYERAVMSQDSRTKTTPVHSACLLSGQELPTIDPALFKRVILLQFERTDYKSDMEAIKQFDRLKDAETRGLSSITTEILRHRQLIEDRFNSVFDGCFEHFRDEMRGEDIEDRIMKNYTVLFSLFEILKDVLGFPFFREELESQMRGMMRTQMQIISNSNDVQKFWDMVEYLFASGEIQTDIDFKIIGEELYLKMSKIYPLYMEAHNRQYGVRGMDKNSLLKYLEMSKAYLESVKSTRFKDSNTSALKFDLSKLQVNLQTTSALDFEQEKFQQIEEHKATKLQNSDVPPF